MYKQIKPNKSTIFVNNSKEGERLETVIERMTTNREPIAEGNVKLMYTERKDGVLPQFDPRTDRFELAVEAMDNLESTRRARGQENPKNTSAEDDKKEGKIVDFDSKKDTKNEGGTQSIEGTSK